MLSMAALPVRAERPDHAQLRRLVELLIVAAGFFGALGLVSSVATEDLGARSTGLLLSGTAAFLLGLRLVMERLSVAVIVGALVSAILTIGTLVAAAQPIYTVFAVVPLLAVGCALPYVRGRLLVATIAAAWGATILITILLETSTHVTVLPHEVQSIFQFGGMILVVGVFLLQLWRFSSRLHGALEQVTESERSRAESEARFKALVDRLAGVVYVSSFGPESPIHYVSPQIADLVGYTPEEWLAGTGLWATRLHPEDRERVLAEEGDWLAEQDTHSGEYRLFTRDGRELWIRDDETVVARHPDGTPSLVQGFMLDITEQKRLQAELSHQAFHDALTGLPNRTYFAEQVTLAIARAQRSNGGLAVVYLDLDDFKVVNDTLGHGAGDRLLMEVGVRLRGALRSGDLAARVGGDEFIVLLEGLSDASVADEVVRRLLDTLSEPYRLDGHDVRIRATAGIAGLDRPDMSAEDLQRQADAALYEAKALGKSRQAWFDPTMSARAWARLDLEHGLRRALDQGEIEVAYQPVMDLRTGAITGMEALARWRHPERGVVPPSEFIPVAERTGLIVDLGREVLREACRAAVRLGAVIGTGSLPVSVNVSARQLIDGEFLTDVRHALDAAGLPADRLTLELTESVMILEGDRTDATVEALRALGVRLAIDDFGTGYSSLSYARRFPIDELKIDRSFVDGLGRSGEDAAIITAAIAFARALRLAVTAEGVETQDQASRLRALGCDRAQGYLFARPMPEAALAASLAEQARADGADRSDQPPLRLLPQAG